MNARLYDPILGRMLSPDNFAHGGSQGLNRYSYAHNNPLSYTDPSGNEPITLTALFVSGLVSAAFDVGFQLIGNGGNLSKVNWGSVGISFVAGATGAWAGQLVGKIPAVAGAISKIASPFWRGAASGAISGAVGGAAGGFTAGYLNGQRGMDLVKATGFGFIVGGVAGGLFEGIKAQRAYNKAQKIIKARFDENIRSLERQLSNREQQIIRGGSDPSKKIPGFEFEEPIQGRFIDNFDDGTTQIQAHDLSLNPNEIHFMQSSIKNTTGEFTVTGNAEALRAGTLDPNVLKISIWKDVNGKIWTLDHRRLAAFRLSGLDQVPAQWSNPTGQMWKMTTTNGGTSIRLKLGNGNSVIVK